ncbi:MAG: hypothetical protein FWG65_00555, partial [Turicibacter sp.]|nr:hypothetical protein [Turicibacter sp.]
VNASPDDFAAILEVLRARLDDMRLVDIRVVENVPGFDRPLFFLPAASIDFGAFELGDWQEFISEFLTELEEFGFNE